MEKHYYWLKVLSFIGVLLATYLLHQQLTLPAFSPCYVNSTVNCDAIIKGEVSKTLGIPTPIYGLIGYLVILIASFLKKSKIVFGTSSFGLVFCIYIGYMELVVLRTICPVCIMCLLTMFATFFHALKLKKLSKS